MNIIMIHGNGGATAEDHWFPSVATALRAKGLTIINQTFPDNDIALASSWLPFLASLGADEDTVIIGHSSGAVAAMRFAETHRILGSVLIGTCYTDLGDATEKTSGWYDAPWDWEAIARNQEWIIHFASTDDPFIPSAESRFVHAHIGGEYREFSDKGHFLIREFPELIEAIELKLETDV